MRYETSMPSVPWGAAQDSPGHPRLSRARGRNVPLLAKVQSDPGSQFKGSHHGAKTRNKLAGSMHGELSRSHVGGALHDRAAHCHTWNHCQSCCLPLAKLMPRMLLPLATSTATALGAMGQTCYHGVCLLTCKSCDLKTGAHSCAQTCSHLHAHT